MRRWGLVAVPWVWFLVRDLSPYLDVAAIVLPVVVAGVVVATAAVSAVRRRASVLRTTASWLLFGLVAIVGPWVPRPMPPPRQRLRVVSANVLGANKTPAAAVRDLTRRRADVVVVEELKPIVDAALRANFPFAVTGPLGTGVGVYAKVPLTSLGPPPALARGGRGMRVRVAGPDGPFVLYALHLPRIWSHPSGSFEVTAPNQRRLIESLVRDTRLERLPVVIAGDLNASDRGGGYRRLVRHRRDAMRDGFAGPTSRKWRWFLVRIDHLLVPPGWCSTAAHRFTVRGSDHRGIEATIGRCRTGPYLAPRARRSPG